MFAGLATLAAKQTFRARTDLVSVYATVADNDGKLVTDLAESDFEVRDNGKVQEVTFFSNDLQPITIIVMLDRSGPMVENFFLVRDAADQFIQKLLPDDKVRIGNFSQDILVNPAKFSSDQNALLYALRHTLQPTGPSPLWTSIDRSKRDPREVNTSLHGDSFVERCASARSAGDADRVRGQDYVLCK